MTGNRVDESFRGGSMNEIVFSNKRARELRRVVYPRR